MAEHNQANIEILAQEFHKVLTNGAQDWADVTHTSQTVYRAKAVSVLNRLCGLPREGALMGRDDDMIRRGDALAVLSDEIDLARIAMPQAVPILSADRRAISALPAVQPAPAPAALRRSFPDAGDGRPMPPMGDELMAAGLSADDARFVAVQLAQNGLTLAVATAPVAPEVAALVEALKPFARQEIPDTYKTATVWAADLRNARTALAALEGRHGS